MKKSHDYAGKPKLQPLVAEISWAKNLVVLARCKDDLEREFYLRQAIREKWSKRELVCQFKTVLFECAVLHPVKVTPLVSQTHPAALTVFKNSYLVEFLDLPQGHLEADPHQGLLHHLKNFLIELGCDSSFVGSEYPLQDGRARSCAGFAVFPSWAQLHGGN